MQSTTAGNTEALPSQKGGLQVLIWSSYPLKSLHGGSYIPSHILKLTPLYVLGTIPRASDSCPDLFKEISSWEWVGHTTG